MRTLRQYLKAKNYQPIPLRTTLTGHFETDASINGIPGTFIVDTGASNSCVGLEGIEKFKLKAKETEVRAAGAGSTDMEAQIASRNSIAIGNWERKRFSLIIFDLHHVNTALVQHHAMPVDGIIGADLLKKAKAIIDYDKKVMYLKIRISNT